MTLFKNDSKNAATPQSEVQMKKKFARITATVLVCVTVLSLFSCSGERAQKLRDYDSSKERYDYDLNDYIKLPEYVGIEIPDLAYSVTDEDMANERIRKLSYFSEEETVKDGSVEKYDIVVCDFSCTVDGKNYSSFDSSLNSARRNVIVGINEFGVKEIDEAFVGMTLDETKTVEFVFPTPYLRDPLMSGKTGKFTVTVSKIRRQTLEEYDDDFISEYYGMSDVETYDAEIAHQLSSQYEKYLDGYENSFAWNYVASNTVLLKIPAKEYSATSDSIVSTYQSAADEKGMTLEEYVTGEEGYESVSAFRDDVDATAKSIVTEEMILFAIVRCDGITLTDSAYESALLDLGSSLEITDISDCEKLAAEKYGSLAKFKETARLSLVYDHIGSKTVKIDEAEYFEKEKNGEYDLDPEDGSGYVTQKSTAFRRFLDGLTLEKAIIILCIALGAALAVIIVLMIVKLARMKYQREKMEAEARALEEKRRQKRLAKQAEREEKQRRYLERKERYSKSPSVGITDGDTADGTDVADGEADEDVGKAEDGNEAE